LAGDAVAQGQVTFDIKFSGHTDCYHPEMLEDVPISVKGTAVLQTDRTAQMDLRLTAYYLLGWKHRLQGKLGDPPEAIGMGVTGALRVLGNNGLALVLDFPETTYTTNIVTDGKRCSAELLARPKSSRGVYNLPAGDVMYKCNRFVVEKSSCRAK
jgi:hypothetical protein